MAPLALTNAFVYADSHDFTGDSNQFALSCDGAANDKTTFRTAITNGGWREFNMGVKTSALSMGGFYQAGADSLDEYSFNALGAVGRVTTCGDVETEGQPAYIFQAMKHNYQLLGSHGENAPFSLQGGCSDGIGVIRGQLAKAMGSVSGTGVLGSALTLGAVGATQYLYATLHLFGTAATTITVVVESDDNGGFSSATTRITLGPFTTVGGRWATRVAGPITDTFWRMRVTAITGTWTVAGAIAIQ